MINRKSIKHKLKQLNQGQIVQEDLFNPINKQLKNIEDKLEISTKSTTLDFEDVKKENIPHVNENGDDNDDEEDYETSEVTKSILKNIES